MVTCLLIVYTSQLNLDRRGDMHIFVGSGEQKISLIDETVEAVFLVLFNQTFPSHSRMLLIHCFTLFFIYTAISICSTFASQQQKTIIQLQVDLCLHYPSAF